MKKTVAQITENIYQEHGFKNREAYLDSLALEYGVSPRVVYAMADVYGPGEDFDALVTDLEDAADMFDE